MQASPLKAFKTTLNKSSKKHETIENMCKDMVFCHLQENLEINRVKNE